MMNTTPISVRLQSALLHLSIITWIPFTVFFKLLPLEVLGCAFKPLEGCSKVPLLPILILTNITLWILPFLSPLFTYLIWQMRKENLFVYNHGRESFYFQLKIAIVLFAFHFTILIFSLWVSSFKASLTLLLVVDLFILPIVAVSQLITAMIAIRTTLKGNYFYYSDYCSII